MSEGVAIEFNDPEFVRILRDYTKVTSKTTSEAINKKAISVAFRASRKIKKGRPLRAKKVREDSALWHALAATGMNQNLGVAVKGKGNAAKAARIRGRRESARGYSKAIALKMAKELGGAVRTQIKNIDHAGAKKARPGFSPTALLYVDGLERKHLKDFIQPGFDRAIDEEKRDMARYIARKMGEQRVRGVQRR